MLQEQFGGKEEQGNVELSNFKTIPQENGGDIESSGGKMQSETSNNIETRDTIAENIHKEITEANRHRNAEDSQIGQKGHCKSLYY